MEVDPKYQVPWREELAANIRGLWLVARSSPWFTLAMLLLALVSGIAPAIVVVQTGALITNITPALGVGLDSAPGHRAQTAIITLGIAIIASQVIGPIRQAVTFGLQRRFHAHLSRSVMTGISDLPGMAYFEDSEFRDKLAVTEWIGWAPAQSVQQFTGGIQAVIQFFAMAVVAAMYAGWAPVVLAVGAIPAGIAAWHYTTVVGAVQWRYSPEIRKANYYKGLGLKKEPGKEMRISGLRDWVTERQGKHWLNGKEEVWKKQRRTLTVSLLLYIVASASVVGVYLSALLATVDGRFEIGAFTASTMGIIGASSSLIAIFQSAAAIRRNNYWLPNALQLMSLAKTEPRLDISGTKSAHGLAALGIVFEGVTFRYAGADRVILDNLNLSIPPGSSIALVGENGAGKTTLIKLMCRFYDPTEGRILLDGVDIREFDLVELRSRLAVIFQDFVHYNLSAADNVGFGAVQARADQALLTESARRVGVLDKINGLPDGWQTVLARDYDGVDLSGGEWQRVALARAMMASLGRDSDVLILDEPTASLDVRLEHELYEHFADLSRGRTTILVSHRFSTVRMAERIVFMQDGRIIEDGTHDELMQSRGRYSELYEIQASHYRESGVLE
ncbi:MAG: ABC transporter ATP-binding protein [Actinomycetota bacterium]